MKNKRPPTYFQADTKVYKLYDACMNERHREKVGIKPAKYFLEAKFGGWPVLNETAGNYR